MKPAKPAPITPGPVGTKAAHAPKPSRYSEAELKEAEAELELLRKTYRGVLDKRAKHLYAEYTKKGWVYRSSEYLTDRDKFFGSKADYQAYLVKARGELEASKARLRRVIEPPSSAREGSWKEAQDVFYAWVRKAYEGSLGADADIAALILAGNSDKLKVALKQVRLDYPSPFSAGGFNPRPIKTTRGYRLGTLSDHALGTAVDIDSGQNAQVEAKDWKQLCAIAGESLDTATREAKWKTAPKELHEAVVRINAAFVAKVKAAVDEQVAKGVKAKDALAAAHKATPELAKVSSSFVSRWHAGFFNLPWDLVQALHEEAFLWGATFGRVDLHHFQL